MKTIPLVYLKKGKEVKKYNNRWVPVPTEEKKVTPELKIKYDEIYVVDIDGYKKNRANLNVYRTFSKKLSFWVDAAPRFPEDVMDLFITGVHKITLRWRFVSDEDLGEIREMCTGEIYLLDDTRIGETLTKVKKMGFDGIVTKEKTSTWKATDAPVWVINKGVNGEELRRIYP